MFSVNASLTGVAVYLDHFAIMDLAEGDVSRRQRFISALHSGGAELLFSVSNLVDLSGPLGHSLDAAKIFLDEIGAHWFPVELDPNIVVKRERDGIGPAHNCLSERFLKDFLARVEFGRILDQSSSCLPIPFGWVRCWNGSPLSAIPFVRAWWTSTTV